MKPVIYLDMDGVICDFMHTYLQLESKIDSVKKFHACVREHRIFEKLQWMPNGQRLITLLRSMDIRVEILSSLGTHTPEIATLAAEQKLAWLVEHDILYGANFVNSWAHKHRYAHKYAIMIDDRHDVIDSFKEAGGLGVQYIDEDWQDMDYKIRQAVTRSKQLWELDNADVCV